MNEILDSINNELYHSGIKGMKWGVRRYQNPDGTLTEAGKKRYQRQERSSSKTMIRNSINDAATAGANLKLARRELLRVEKKLEKASGEKKTELSAKQKLLDQYVKNQEFRNDFAVKNAERTNALMSKYANMKPRDIPMETTKNGERFVIEQANYLKLLTFGEVGSGVKRIYTYKKSLRDYEWVKRNGYNPDSNWRQLYKDYDLKYPKK